MMHYFIQKSFGRITGFVMIDIENMSVIINNGKPIKSATVAAPEIATPGSSPSSLITANTG